MGRKKLIVIFITSFFVLSMAGTAIYLGTYHKIHPRQPAEYPRHDPGDPVDLILMLMETANIAFNPPKRLNIDDKHELNLILSFKDTIEQLKEIISYNEDIAEGYSIKATNRMEANLMCYEEEFAILNVTPEVQAVSKEKLTEWKWIISPKKAGKYTLYLSIYALIEVNGRETPRSIKTFKKEIKVTVTGFQRITVFLCNNWKWLWSFILIPLGGWLWKRKKHNNEKTTQTTKTV